MTMQKLPVAVLFVLVGIGLNEFIVSWTLNSGQPLAIENVWVIRIFQSIVLLSGAVYSVFSKPNFFAFAFSFLCASGTYLTWEYVTQSRSGSQIEILTANPNGTGSYRLKGNYRYEGGGFIIETNEHGMHWHAAAKTKAEGIRRIAFVGDSSTFGLSATHYSKGFVGVIESLLDDDKIELLNFGVSGYGFDDIFLLVNEVVLSFDIDALVLVPSNGNDYRDSYFGLNKYNIIDGRAYFKNSPAYTKLCGKDRSDDDPALTRLARSSLGLVQNSALIQGLKRHSERGYGTASELDVFTVSENFCAYTYWARELSNKDQRKAVTTAIGLSAKIFDLAESRKILPIVIHMPFYEQIYAPHDQGVDGSGNGYNVSYPQKFLTDYAVSRNISVIDVLPELRHQVRQENVRMFNLDLDRAHFDDTGHAIFGAVVAPRLLETIRVKLQ
jgi:hypothetical protein